MPVDVASQLLIDDILQLYADAQHNLLDETIRVAADPSLRSATYRQRLAGMARAIDEAMADLDAAAQGWTGRSLPQVYALGAERAAAQAGERFNWTQVHREAVQVLAQDTYQDLLTATRYVRRDTKAFIRYAAREHARTVLLEGKTATQAGRQLAQRLQSRGIAAVTYRNGARHGLRDYSDTVIRTKSAMAYNGGAINVGRENGIEWVQVSDGAGCGWEAHGSVDLANGSVRTLAEAEEHPIAHPRCARSFSMLPVRTRAEAEAVARGDYSALQPARTPAPTAGGGGHDRRIAQRQQRLEARQARVASRTAVQTRPQVGVSARTVISEMPGPRSAVGEGARHTFDQIDKVHRIPDGLAPVPIKNSSSTSYFGQYSYTRGRLGRPDAIRIRTKGDHISGTTAHEFGHYIDHQGNLVGQLEKMAERSPGDWAGVFGSSPVGRQDPLMQAFFDAVEDTPTWKALAEEAAGPRARLNGASYYVQRNEVWARSYHQWIATRSGDRRMLDEIQAIRIRRADPNRRITGLSQWEDDEFGPVADALDAIFRAKGLLVE